MLRDATPMAEDDDSAAAVIDFLRAHALARVPHSAADLLAHLRGTAALLRRWGARDPVVLAGLCHSVFGTEMYGGEALPEGLRGSLAALIGDEAARLCWLFGVIERASFGAAVRGEGPAIERRCGVRIEVSEEELAELAEIYAANAVEQIPRLPEVCAVVERSLLAPCADLLSPAAAAAVAAMRGEDADAFG